MECTDAIADNDWLRQDERDAWARRIRQLRQELAQGQAQLSPPEPISPEQLRRERKSVRSIASSSGVSAGIRAQALHQV